MSNCICILIMIHSLMRTKMMKDNRTTLTWFVSKVDNIEVLVMHSRHDVSVRWRLVAMFRLVDFVRLLDSWYHLGHSFVAFVPNFRPNVAAVRMIWSPFVIVAVGQLEHTRTLAAAIDMAKEMQLAWTQLDCREIHGLGPSRCALAHALDVWMMLKSALHHILHL